MPGLFYVPDQVVSELLDGEAVVLHLRTGKYFSLNVTGTRMWALLGKYGDLELALQHLGSEFQDVEPGVLRADLVTFIDELLSRGLIERRPG